MESPRAGLIGKINRYASVNQPFLFAVDFLMQDGFVLTPEEATQRGIRFRMGSNGNETLTPGNAPQKFIPSPVCPEEYKMAFDKVQFHLGRGDTYLLNLTFHTPVETDQNLDEIFTAARAPFKLLVPGAFAIFSPEAFVTIAGGVITSCPMKGTISADSPDAPSRLLADRKEAYEHNTIVDLIRNDISMVAADVIVTRFRYLDLIRTNLGDLWQMSSEIRGTLPAGYRNSLGDIIFRLLPAGSVTGAPKEKTVQIIRDVEPLERGFYTGIFGYFDGNNLHSAVSIRFIRQSATGLVFQSGGGITALSDPDSEYREMIKKVYVPVV
jgi:para-aminobenzoate synthetase component 1